MLATSCNFVCTTGAPHVARVYQKLLPHPFARFPIAAVALPVAFCKPNRSSRQRSYSGGRHWRAGDSRVHSSHCIRALEWRAHTVLGCGRRMGASRYLGGHRGVSDVAGDGVEGELLHGVDSRVARTCACSCVASSHGAATRSPRVKSPRGSAHCTARKRTIWYPSEFTLPTNRCARFASARRAATCTNILSLKPLLRR